MLIPKTNLYPKVNTRKRVFKIWLVYNATDGSNWASFDRIDENGIKYTLTYRRDLTPASIKRMNNLALTLRHSSPLIPWTGNAGIGWAVEVDAT